MTTPTYLTGAIDAADCVGQAWEMMKRNPGLYIGAGVITILMISCIPFVNFFLVGPIMGGFAYLVLRELRGEPVEFGMLFKGFEKFLPLMVLGLIQSLPGIAFQIIQWTVDLSFLGGAGGSDVFEGGGMEQLQAGLATGTMVLAFGVMFFQIIWNAILVFAIPLIVEHDLSVGESITTGLSAAVGNVGGLILLVIVNMLVGLLGFIAICLGLLVAIPVIYMSYTVAYRQVFPDIQRRVETAPPSPSEYGSSFGTGL